MAKTKPLRKGASYTDEQRQSKLCERSQVERSEHVTQLVFDILEDPVGFCEDPDRMVNRYEDWDFDCALSFFSAQYQERFMHSLCTSFMEKRVPKVGTKLASLGFIDIPVCRFWPLLCSNNLVGVTELDTVEDFILNFWNSRERMGSFSAGMFFQTGFIETERKQAIGDTMFFRFTLPALEHERSTPATITIAFDSKTGSFLTVNSRVRHAEGSPQFRYVEFIAPHLEAPSLENFIGRGHPKQWKILLVLDRHIGDNLSLLSTHVPSLARVQEFDLTIDASACPLFHNAPETTLRRFLPANVSLVQTIPVDRSEFDLIFDPYDWLDDVFSRKVQNDSSAIGIVSSLEYARCATRKHRRDILEIHFNNLKRMGIIGTETPLSKFIMCRFPGEERRMVRDHTRKSLLSGSRNSPNAKIVCFFPFGDAVDRRYPVKQLQGVFGALLKNPDVHIVVAGNQADIPELIQAVRSDWPGVPQPCLPRIKVFLNEPLDKLLNLMLASDLVVSMDSGPLHLARALRIHPVALYTKKVNDEKSILHFPWLVEDGTVETLKPALGEDHVDPEELLSTVRRRLFKNRQ